MSNPPFEVPGRLRFLVPAIGVHTRRIASGLGDPDIDGLWGAVEELAEHARELAEHAQELEEQLEAATTQYSEEARVITPSEWELRQLTCEIAHRLATFVPQAPEAWEAGLLQVEFALQRVTMFDALRALRAVLDAAQVILDE